MRRRSFGRTSVMAAALSAVLLLLVPTAGLQAKSLAEELEGDDFLPIGMTAEELLMLDRIGERHRATPPATGPVRNPGEFEPMTGVIVRYPWGNPTSLLAEYAEDVTLWVIVEDAGDQSAATSDLTSAGANMAHVDWIFAPTNSIWTRDYGPWFLIDGNGEQGINDHIYNRPRPQDDLIPSVIGTDWGIPVYGMDLEATGGNYMTDGRGVSMSTRLTLDENTGFTTAEIDSIMNAYLGIEQFHWLPYIESGGIHHIDCWAKFLGPEKILLREVPSGHSAYAAIESNCAYLSSITSSYGRPYEIVRVYTPNNEPYTNSIIINDKVFVPQYGTTWDDDALQTYGDAMPGYEVLGYTGSWLSDDAIHCRAMGVTDRYMLYIDHVPLPDSPSTIDDYRVEADIIDGSETGLIADSLVVYWETDSAPGFAPIVMTVDSRAGSYYAEIPAQSLGTVVSYYIHAADQSGRSESHPYIGRADAHSFEIVVDTESPSVVHTPLTDITAGQWPPTTSAEVIDNTVVSTVTLQSWINGAPQTDVAMTRVGTSGTFEGSFTGTAVAGDAVTYRIVAEDGANPPNIAYEPPAGTHAFDVLDAIACVIWEPDPSPSSGAAIATILDAKDISYDYTTDMPDFGQYSAAFICLGVYSQNVSLSAAQANALVAYLDAGGNAYMEGGECWAYDSTKSIYNPYFGINGTLDGSGDLYTVLGVDGTMCEGMSLAYSGPNSSIDHVEPLTGATKILKNSGDQAGCGVSHDSGAYKTVGFSFEFGGLTDGASPSTKDDLLTEILVFFGLTQTGVDDGVFAFRLEQNRPNPFNPVTTLAFELPASGRVELRVYNAAGKRVATLIDGRAEAGRRSVSWRGLDDGGRPVASGVYFFRLTHDGETVSRKGVLLK
ncbi:MAG: agmatine deiminase family protein [Candidatus Eisenbacteria bacterium]